MTRAGRVAAAALVLSGCGPAPAPAAPPIELAPPSPVAPEPAASARPTEDPAVESRRQIHDMLARVAGVRGLPIRREVPGQILDREHILARIRAHVEKEIPLDAVMHEGELLAALELVPPDYDFVEGTYKLIQGRIAGFYEPADHTMYLVDDLSEDEAAETLAHELGHALQDQSFPLSPILEFSPGDGDRVAAAHAIIEGDATSAMLDVTAGSAFNVSDTALRRLLALSNAASETAAATPHVLQASLVAPYADGFAFVQRRRQKGGWASVDAALRALPQSTEQLLHEDKYEARERPIPVAVPTFAALGPGFRAVLDDVAGEQGLRLMLEEWTGEAVAARAAAGWGGDRYVVARRDDAPDRHSIAVGWRAVFDTERDAIEVGDLLKERFGVKCRTRASVGPLAWQRRRREVVIAAGPYERRGIIATGGGSCAAAARWVQEMLKGGPAKR